MHVAAVEGRNECSVGGECAFREKSSCSLVFPATARPSAVQPAHAEQVEWHSLSSRKGTSTGEDVPSPANRNRGPS